jgi:hypothetical protein
VGGSCAAISLNQCRGQQGICDASGKCQGTPLTGQACIPGPQSNVCASAVEGTCDASGSCVPKYRPEGVECRPPGGDPCAVYICQTFGATETATT